MTRLYIQYLENTPVSLFTQNLPVPEGEEPDISDLVAAYKAATTPRFENIPVDELTIHCWRCASEIHSGAGINDFVRKGIPTYWKVSGALSDSLAVKGVCSRMYRNADNHLGYYESGQPAFFYEENKPTLKINVLFETKENALRFDSHLRNESITINSPMNSLTINSSVSTTSTAQLGERIYYKDYIPTDSESPQDTQSVITIQFSTFEKTSDEFKYQRIEKLSIFGSMGKAESCHLISDSHCRNYPSYSQYDKDPNNRLAMSMDLHGWFVNLSTEIPLFYLKIVSISDSVIVEDRYKVVLAVVALNQESADMIFYRLIEGSTKTDNPLIMNTSVHVTNPTIFRKCLEWKEKETMKKWDDYYSMDSAVP
ncbi:hypothetical protein QVD99_001353 [Batrachochytrium dendrobatidis]|nr:hypothetical protein QVD99_001353 [Batrachochytrium dendrobatidis]